MSIANKQIKRAALFAVVIIVAAVTHFGAVYAPFHFDDFSGIVENPSVRHPGYFFKYWTDPHTFSYSVDTAMYRPLTMSSYLADYLWRSYRPRVWHITNLVFHLLNVLLVMLIARRLLESKRAAAVAALIFGCHPAGVETGAYISARSGLMATTFGLVALLAAGWNDSSKVRRAGKLALSGFLYAMALASKENAASFPAVAFLLGFSSKDTVSRRRWWATTCVWAVVLLFYLGWRKWGLEFPTLPDSSDRSMVDNFIMQISVLAHYLRLLFWPWGISVVYGMKMKVTLLEEPAPGMLPPLMALILLVCIVAAAIIKRKKSPEIFVGIGWFFLTMLPESIMPLNQAANDRRLYFPMIGIIIAAVSAGAGAIRRRSRAWQALPIIVAGLFALLSVHRVDQWKSSIALWTDGIKQSPNTSVTWINLGHSYADLGMLDKALDIFQKGYAVNPDSDDLINNIGVIFVEKNRLQEAAEIFAKLAIKYPRYPDGWYNLGTVLYQLGKFDQAEKAFRSLLEISPGYAEGHLNLGNCLYKAGDLEGAKREFEEALKFDPELLEAERNLRTVEEKISGQGH